MYLCITKINKYMKTKIISILNQKGGCGKTTLATNIAHSFLIKGYKTLLVDSDPQGSAREWGEVNEGKIVPIVGLDRESLINNIKSVQEGYDIIIIDGAPSIAKLSVAAIKESDIV
jgi:chromosome partitioning protein